MQKQGVIKKMPLRDFVAATSVGIFDGAKILDLCYAEDSKAAVDMNVIMTGSGKFIEVQGTAERQPFSAEDLQEMLSLASGGVKELIELQKKLVGELR
jgi:ribonuclease PH